jgi:hypothetical protein
MSDLLGRLSLASSNRSSSPNMGLSIGDEIVVYGFHYVIPILE